MTQNIVDKDYWFDDIKQRIDDYYESLSREREERRDREEDGCDK
jgi:hypothetical protein